MSNIEKLMINRNNQNRNKINDEIAIAMRDPNYKLNEEGLRNELIATLNKDLIKINKNKLTWSQESVFKSMKDNKNLFISAKTSFGKTWISMNAIKEKFSEIISDKNINIIVLHIVPNDILEMDIIVKAKEIFEDMDVNISNEYIKNKNNYLIGTAEKIYSQLSKMIKINFLIVDEAHEIFYDSERPKFYKFTIDRILKEFEPTFWFIGAFLKKNHFEEYSNKIKHEIFFIKPIGFKSNYIIKNDKTILIEGEKIENQNFKGNSRLTLNFYNTVKKAEKGIEDFMYVNNKWIDLLDKNVENLVRLSKKDFWKKIIESFNVIKNNDMSYSAKSYNVLNGWKVGIAIYHSQMPSFFKEITYKLIKDGYIKEIFSTSSIMSGIDINPSIINIPNMKINNTSMKVSDFLNLAGRSGRYKPGAEQELGLVNVYNNYDNNIWFNNNYEKILNRRYNELDSTSSIENKDSNINDTIKCLEESDTNLHAYLIVDPRVHPDITLKIAKNKELRTRIIENFKILFRKIKKIEWDGLNWVDKDFAIDNLRDFIKLYTADDYKFKGRYNLKEFKDGHIKVIRNFIKYILIKEEYKMYTDYAYHLNSHFEKNDKYFGGKTYSEAMRKFSDIFNSEIKYALYSYFSHFITLCNIIDGTLSIDDIKEKNEIFKDWLKK